MTVSKLHELEEQLRALLEAIEEEKARIREEAEAENEPIIKRLNIWTTLFPEPDVPPDKGVDVDDIEWGPDGWEAHPDLYMGFFNRRVFAVRDMHAKSKDRAERLGSKLNPTFWTRWVTDSAGGYTPTTQDQKFVINNHNQAQLKRRFVASRMRDKQLPPVYAEWTNPSLLFGWGKRPKPVEESKLPYHKLLWTGNQGIAHARKAFEEYVRGPYFVTDCVMYGKGQLKAYDHAWNALKDDDVKYQFLQENPWYEPKDEFTYVPESQE